MKYDNDNIFAEMIRGDLDCIKAYEDEICIVIMDIMPKSVGHCLVIPKVLARNILDIEDADLKSLITKVKKVAKAAMQAYHADGITIMQNNETAAGQCVFHLHFHVIPRYKNIEMRDSGSDNDSSTIDFATLKEQANLLASSLTK